MQTLKPLNIFKDKLQATSSCNIIKTKLFIFMQKGSNGTWGEKWKWLTKAPIDGCKDRQTDIQY